MTMESIVFKDQSDELAQTLEVGAGTIEGRLQFDLEGAICFLRPPDVFVLAQALLVMARRIQAEEEATVRHLDLHGIDDNNDHQELHVFPYLEYDPADVMIQIGSPVESTFFLSPADAVALSKALADWAITFDQEETIHDLR